MKHVSATFKSRAFLETNLGRLAPEIRQTIYDNLLARPPPYGGRDFRVKQAPLASQLPTSLTTFVDLKASCLPVLQTCRQVYFEAFPIFYASKAYYLANPQDLVKFLELGQYLRGGPQLFRVDTITFLCLKDLTTTRPKWRPQDIDHLMSLVPTLDRARLEAEQHTALEFKLFFEHLEGMKCLRKICFCMRVGQELQYLRFLFGIKGLGRGVVDFVDNSHWTIRSQSVSEDHWSLQYTPFVTGFYRRGKDLEMLDYEVVKIQEEVLDIDSRASDLVNENDRWVEVDIGSRNYEEMLPLVPQRQPVPVNVSTQDLEDQERVSDEEAVESATDEESDHESEPLQGQLDGETNTTQISYELAQDFDEPQAQPDEEEDGTRIYNQQGQESGNLQQQPDEIDDVLAEIELRLGSVHLQSPDARDHNAQADYNTNVVLEILQGPSNEARTSVATENVLREGMGDFEASMQVENGPTPTVNQPDQGPEGSAELPEGRFTYNQAETDHPDNLESNPELGDENNLEHQPTEIIQATPELSLGASSHDYRDAQTQTASVDPRNRTFETQMEQRGPARGVQRQIEMMTVPTLKVLRPDHGAIERTKARNRVSLPFQPDSKPFRQPQDVAISRPEKSMAAMSFHQTRASMSQKPKVFVATTANESTLETDHELPQAPGARLHLPRCESALGLMLALSLLYIVVYAGEDSTLEQLLALFLFVFVLIATLGSEND